MKANLGELLQRLNIEQREAVESIEGPVMVIAGPGTGKTEILASRICNIIATTDTSFESILCLTFTDAGSIAMRKRLLKYIGTEAHKIPIFTFHSFCNSIIQDNKEYFSLKSLDAVSDIEKYEIAIELIDEISNDSVLKRWTGDLYYEARKVLNLISVMKSEGFTPEFIKLKADEFIQEIQERDEYRYKRAVPAKGIKAGDVKIHEINEIQSKLSKLIAASELMPLYETKLSQKGRYDFQDMLSWVVNAFYQFPDLLLKYQERFLYVLVDEYQDTNAIQSSLVNTLMDYWGEEANLFVVGDDDQSIYRFQGASIENVLLFKEKYAYAKTILLTNNYRSTQLILNAALALIKSNKERLSNQNEIYKKHLIAPVQNSEEKKPRVLEFHNQLYEATYIAEEIKKLIDQGIHAEEIAVIYRNHKQVETITEALTYLKIPFILKRSINVLKDESVLSLINMLQYIDAELRIPFSGEDKLFEILHLSGFGIESTLIAEFTFETKALKVKNKFSSWRSYASNFQSDGLFSVNSKYKKIVDVIRELDSIISESANAKLLPVFSRLLNFSKLIDSALLQENKIEELNFLRTFLDFIKEQVNLKPDITIYQFLDLLRNMNRFELSIPFVQTLGTTKGVNLLTAHSSKGLEFESVYIVSSLKESWEGSRSHSDWFFPENIVPHHASGNKVEEERRLFYVAMTRAKSNLSISYYNYNSSDKSIERSLFVDELVDSETVEYSQIQLTEDRVLPVFLEGLHSTISKDIFAPDKDIIENFLQNYKLSVTHLNSYLRCPRSYYYNYIIQVPAIKNAAMEFGSAVHETLYKYFKLVMDSGLFPAVSQMLEIFESELIKRRAAFLEKELKQKLDYGKNFLPKYYENGISKWSKILALERNVQCVVNGIPIKGIIDKIEFSGKSAVVIDYKTGKHEYSKNKLKGPGEHHGKLEFEKEYGGDYWRQAVFYKILIDNYTERDWRVESTVFEFVEPDPKTNVFYQEKIMIQSEDIEMVKKQIAFAHEKIMNFEFEQKCNDENCYWCSFESKHIK